MDKEDAKKFSLQLMEIAEIACVTTIDDSGFPQSRAMFNLRRREQFPCLVELFKKQNDDFLVYFTTNTSSSKVAQIRKNPRVSVYYSKPDEWRGLMLGGKIEIAGDRETKEKIWQKGWELYYPGGPHDPDHTLLKLHPMTARYYHQLDSFTFNFRERK